MPSEVYQEWLDSPVGFIEHVIEVKHARRYYGMLEHAETPAARKALPKDGFMQLIQTARGEVIEEAMARG